jgi:hypothetical protein
MIGSDASVNHILPVRRKGTLTIFGADAALATTALAFAFAGWLRTRSEPELWQLIWRRTPIFNVASHLGNRY